MKPLDERFEIQIQKCIDDELSCDETRALFLRMPEIHGAWQALASGFVEDRLLRKSVRRSHQAALSMLCLNKPAVMQSTVADNPRQKIKRQIPDANWRRHQMTSLGLCVAIAFVCGMLMPRWNVASTSPITEPSNSGLIVDESNRSSVPIGVPSPDSKQSPVTSAVPLYHVQWSPDASSTRQPIQIPVYNGVDDWAHELAKDGDLFAPVMAGKQHSPNQGETSLIRIPLNDAQDILLLVRDENLGLPFQ